MNSTTATPAAEDASRNPQDAKGLSPYFCPHCHQPMRLDETPGGELVYACVNTRCCFIVHASTVLASCHTAETLARVNAIATRFARGAAILDNVAYSNLAA